MKNLLIVIGAIALTIAAPYLAVMLVWCLTFGAFNYQEVVMSTGFGTSYVLYWCVAWLIPVAIHDKYCD